jgi:hypothetical protein
LKAWVVSCPDQRLSHILLPRPAIIKSLASVALIDGIVSVGDVVKQRLDEVQFEVDELRQYVSGALAKESFAYQPIRPKGSFIELQRHD